MLAVELATSHSMYVVFAVKLATSHSMYVVFAVKLATPHSMYVPPHQTPPTHHRRSNVSDGDGVKIAGGLTLSSSTP